MRNIAPASHRRSVAKIRNALLRLGYSLLRPFTARRGRASTAYLCHRRSLRFIANASLRISAATQSRSSRFCAPASQIDSDAMRPVRCRSKPLLCVAYPCRRCVLHILRERRVDMPTRCHAVNALPPHRFPTPSHRTTNVLSAALPSLCVALQATPAHVHALPLPLRGDALPLRIHAHLAIACSTPLRRRFPKLCTMQRFPPHLFADSLHPTSAPCPMLCTACPCPRFAYLCLRHDSLIP